MQPVDHSILDVLKINLKEKLLTQFLLEWDQKYRLHAVHFRAGFFGIQRYILVDWRGDHYFFELAHKMGIKRIADILDRFGFGQLTGIDVDEELPGTVASPNWKRKNKGVSCYEGDTLNAGIGQGYMQATPIQLAYGVSTIANRGLRFTPHLLLANQTSGKKPSVEPIKPKEPVVLENNESWSIVIDAMQGVTTAPNGTATYRFGKSTPYTVAGKTGTGQVYSIKHRDAHGKAEKQENLPEHLRDHSLFVAFAPIEDPKIAIAVIVENNKLAVTVARKLLDTYLTNAKTPLNIAAEEVENTYAH